MKRGRQQVRHSAVVVFAQMLLAALAGLENWAADDAAILLTAAERKTWQGLRDDRTRRGFIDSFWLRRDPTPRTALNEFRDEHYRRLLAARNRFAPGSDETRVYVVLGPCLALSLDRERGQ